ncbi:MAG: nucleotidyltransferase family protein [Bacteroidota bacterium]
MSRQEIQNIIISCLKDYHPEYVGLFGSFVRGNGSAESDIDILVRFKESYSLLQLVRIENELSDKLGIKVDLVTEGSLKNERVKQSINQDLRIIYEA